MLDVRVSDLLPSDHVIWDVSAPDKPVLIQMMAHEVAKCLPDVDADVVVDLVEEREAVQSTGIGDGLALPHAMVPGVRDPTLFLFRLTPEVNYQSLDGQPVDVVFLLLSPSTGLRDHLRLLARVARIVGQVDLLDRLRLAKAGDEAYRILLEEDEQQAW
jgi:PTS system nitrogen regulatory IIA component